MVIVAATKFLKQLKYKVSIHIAMKTHVLTVFSLFCCLKYWWGETCQNNIGYSWWLYLLLAYTQWQNVLEYFSIFMDNDLALFILGK